MGKLTAAKNRRASQIHRDAIVVDSHCDTLMFLVSSHHSFARDISERSQEGHIDLPRILEGGVDCQTFAVYTGERVNQPGALHSALRMMDSFFEMCGANEALEHVRNSGEILSAVSSGRVAALLAIEGAEPLVGDIGILRVMYRLGVRMLSFTWNWRTPFADGLSAKRSRGKLTDLGVEALREMERLGMVLDVSHISDECFWDIVDLKNEPFIASHSNCRSICDHPRNLSDDIIRALADRKGVMGMNFSPTFISEKNASVESLVDHIDHIVDLVGPDHVGLGSDFDGINSTPTGLSDVSKMPNITRELVRREYSDEDVVKVLGGNHLRVFEKTLR